MSVCTSFNAIPFLTHKMLRDGGLIPGTCERRRGVAGHAYVRAVWGFRVRRIFDLGKDDMLESFCF